MEAMMEEMSALIKNNTWKVVDLPIFFLGLQIVDQLTDSVFP